MHSQSLFHSLQARQAGNNSPLNQWIANNPINNLLNDNHQEATLEFNDSVFFKGMCKDYLAVITRDDYVAFRNLAEQPRQGDTSFNRGLEKLVDWQVRLPAFTFNPLPENFKYTGVQVSETGLVICIAAGDAYGSTDAATEVQIFSEGKHRGTFHEYIHPGSLNVVDDRIFALSNDKLFLLEWNRDAEQVQSTEIIDQSEEKTVLGGTPFFTKNKDYLVIVTTNQRFGDFIAIPVFVFNLQTNESYLQLVQFQHPVWLNCIYLTNNVLYFAKSDMRGFVNDEGTRLFRESSVIQFDLSKKKLINEFPIKDCTKAILHLAANSETIAVVPFAEYGYDAEIKLINIEDKATSHLTIIRSCLENDFPKSIHLSFFKNLLTVTYPTGSWNTGWLVWRMNVFELYNFRLSNLSPSKSYDFPSFPGIKDFRKFSFHNNRIIISGNQFNTKIKIHDFGVMFNVKNSLQPIIEVEPEQKHEALETKEEKTNNSNWLKRNCLIS